jgi:F-type H+-transporting ATPase subunit beta
MSQPAAKPNSGAYVVSVQGPVVDVRFASSDDLPKIYDMVTVPATDGRTVTLEVCEHLSGGIARCIAMSSTYNIQRRAVATSLGVPISIPIGEGVYKRIMNVMGDPIDQKGPIPYTEKRPIRRPQLGTRVAGFKSSALKPELIETGIKILDLLFPVFKGSKTGIPGGAALGKSVLTLEIIHHIVKKHHGTCVFTGAGERIREGNELYFELERHEILDKMMMVFGQMNEPPGARFGIAMTGITLAESIQRQNKDVLLFVDNIFRFIQAGAEISTLLGRVPSETGYQPTLLAQVAEFHERIRSSEEAGGSITSFEAVYVPADDLTDPAVVAIFSFLDNMLVLSRERIQLGLYPAIDPLLSSSATLDPDLVGERHFRIAQDVLQIFQKYEELRRIVLVVGIDELSMADRAVYERARKLNFFLTQPFFVAEAYTGKKGEFVTREQALEGCERIVSGRVDYKPEGEFYMIGALP